MNCASNPSKPLRPRWREAIVEFPVVGGQVSSMNHARVMAYCDSQGRVVSVPSSRNHAERAKVVIDDARYGEHRPRVDLDVVVHFARNDFDGLSFGLALALADKRARYGVAEPTGRIVATGTIEPLGQVAEVEGFSIKLACVERELTPGDLFIYPARNVPRTDALVLEVLQRLQHRGIVLRAVEHIGQLSDLWRHGIVAPSSGAPEGALPTGGITMTYTAEISRVNPSCLLFLIDQSGSMSDRVGEESERSKADRLADAINRLLYELIIRCTKNQTEGPRNYYDVGVIGYGSRVGSALGGVLAGRDLVPIREVADHPARVESRQRKVEDGTGGLIEETVKFALWFDPVANGGTPMGQALRQARALLEPWVQAHATSFPPIVINITDGEATDGDPRPLAEALRTLATADGNVLLFNLHLSARPGAPVLYPDSEMSLPDEFARQLFQMSSLLPPHIREAAGSAGYTVGPQARGFVFNADIVEVIKFLDLGTRAELR
jgi:hypothetical protein